MLLQEFFLIQDLEDGIRWQFTIDGVKQDKVYHLYFPILFFMGDTMEHNKLCSLQGHHFPLKAAIGHKYL